MVVSQESKVNPNPGARLILPERKLRVLSVVDRLINLHKLHLATIPYRGKSGNNYFKYPEMPDEIIEEYDDLNAEDIGDFVNLWVNSDLGVELLKTHPVLAIGHFLQTMCKFQSTEVTTSLNDQLESSDMSGNINALVKIQDIYELLPFSEFIIRHDEYLSKRVKGLTKRETCELEEEILTKSAIDLFAFGIVTRKLHEIFNHHQYKIILTQFDNTHIPALKAAYKHPKIVDSFAGKHITGYNINLAIMGVQKRAKGGFDKNVLLRLKNDNSMHQATSAYLQFFFADTDKDALTDPDILRFIQHRLNYAWLSSIIEHILITKSPVNINSYLADTICSYGLDMNNAAKYMKIALDVYDGKWEEVDPVMKYFIEESLKTGAITPERLAPLIASCIGFGVDLPDFLDRQLDPSYFAHSLDTDRTGGIYSQLPKHNHDLVYALMINGLDSLPPKISVMLREQNSNINYDLIAADLLRLLFQDGYFKSYFKGKFSHKFPEAIIDIHDIKGNMHEIVHRDIWDLILKADKSSILEIIENIVPNGMVDIYFNNDQTGVSEHTNIPMADCLSPDLVEKLGDLSYLTRPPSESRTLIKRLKWARVADNLFREGLAREERIKSTDMIRQRLIPRYFRKGLDILSQIRLIHRAHMRRKEQLVLLPSQAERMLNENLGVVHLGGVVRNAEELNINTGLENMIALCASYENTPKLMQMLSGQIEQLFPLESINPIVDSDSIYYFASAFQLYLALIHPFYECNGRTSEDAMYILWQRRSDLADTIRYISYEGSREGDMVQERMKIINQAALDLVHSIGLQLGLTEADIPKIRNFYDLDSFLYQKYKITLSATMRNYLSLYDAILEDYIERMTDLDNLMKGQTITKLANQLRSASRIYTFTN